MATQPSSIPMTESALSRMGATKEIAPLASSATTSPVEVATHAPPAGRGAMELIDPVLARTGSVVLESSLPATSERTMVVVSGFSRQSTPCASAKATLRMASPCTLASSPPRHETSRKPGARLAT